MCEPEEEGLTLTFSIESQNVTGQAREQRWVRSLPMYPAAPVTRMFLRGAAVSAEQDETRREVSECSPIGQVGECEFDRDTDYQADKLRVTHRAW